MYLMSEEEARDLIGLGGMLDEKLTPPSQRKFFQLREIIAALYRLPQSTPGIDVKLELWQPGSGLSRWWRLTVEELELTLTAGVLADGESGADSETEFEWSFFSGGEPDKKGSFEWQVLVALAETGFAGLQVSGEGGVAAKRRNVISRLRARLGSALRPEVRGITYWQSSSGCYFEIFTDGSISELAEHLSENLTVFAGVDPTRTLDENLVILVDTATAYDYYMTAACDPWLIRLDMTEDEVRAVTPRPLPGRRGSGGPRHSKS